MEVYDSEDEKEVLAQEIGQPSFDENSKNFNFKIVSFTITMCFKINNFSINIHFRCMTL